MHLKTANFSSVSSGFLADETWNPSCIKRKCAPIILQTKNAFAEKFQCQVKKPINYAFLRNHLVDTITNSDLSVICN